MKKALVMVANMQVNIKLHGWALLGIRVRIDVL